MRLRNKKTGEIVDKSLFINYNSLAELNEEWEDYEEPKGYWYYDTTCGRVDKVSHNEDKEIDSSIGNCFDTREEAEKAVEKLKAWKRLKDMTPDIRIVSNYSANRKFRYGVAFGFTDKEDEDLAEIDRDIKLLFGGEE